MQSISHLDDSSPTTIATTCSDSTAPGTNNTSAQRNNLQSFPIHSNLPHNDYAQVFGRSNDVVHVIDDLTTRVDQTLSTQANQYELVNERYDQLLDHLQRLEGIVSHLSENSASLTSATSAPAASPLPYYDDYPWYSNHYSIIDAENRFYQYLAPSSSVDDGETFQLVQRRKRERRGLVTVEAEVLTHLSPHIDLAPVVLHGSPTAPSVVSAPPAAVAARDVPTTTKSKKKKEEKEKYW